MRRKHPNVARLSMAKGFKPRGLYRKRSVKIMEVSMGISPVFTGKTAKRIMELSELNETSLNTSFIEESKATAKRNGWIIKKRR